MGFALARPDEAELRGRLARQAQADFTYPEPGASRDPARLVRDGFERRYRLDHWRVKLGTGVRCFERAWHALAGWEPLRIDWLTIYGAEAPLAEATCIGMLTRAAGLWCFNTCRVVYVDHESGPVETRAFAWGTLPEHALRGEERFAVEYHHGNDGVWYDLLAFSRPRHPLAWAGLPLVRRLQARFGRDSLAALQRALAI